MQDRRCFCLDHHRRRVTFVSLSPLVRPLRRPIDEYGFPTAEKFPHLTALHFLLQAYSSVIIDSSNGIDREVRLSANVSRMDYGNAQFGVIFLINKVDTPQTVTVTTDHERKVTVPGTAVLAYDWTTFELMYDTSDVSHSRRILDSTGLFTDYYSQPSITAPSSYSWTPSVSGWAEPTSAWRDDGLLKSTTPLELLDISRHTSDHVYYQTLVTLNDSQIQKGQVAFRLRDVTTHFHLFFNGQFIAFGSGDGAYEAKVTGLKAGTPYNVTVVVQQDGSINCCGGLEKFNEGILGDVQVDGRSLLSNGWIHLVGLKGEALQLPTIPSSVWQESAPTHTPWVWYRLMFDVTGPLPTAWVVYQLDMTSTMGKGQVWINGHALGRYWNITDENGHLSQQYNHVPAAWLVGGGRGLQEVVVWEELGGDPTKVELSQRTETATVRETSEA